MRQAIRKGLALGTSAAIHGGLLVWALYAPAGNSLRYLG